MATENNPVSQAIESINSLAAKYSSDPLKTLKVADDELKEAMAQLRRVLAKSKEAR